MGRIATLVGRGITSRSVAAMTRGHARRASYRPPQPATVLGAAHGQQRQDETRASRVGGRRVIVATMKRRSSAEISARSLFTQHRPHSVSDSENKSTIPQPSQVKGEGEKPSSISSSYININSSCIFIFLEQEYRNLTFTLTFTRTAARQIGQVPETVAYFLCVQYKSPGGRGGKGRWGRGFSASRRRGSGDRGRASGGIRATSSSRSIALLRAAGADSGLSGGVVDRIWIARSSDPAVSHKPITR